MTVDDQAVFRSVSREVIEATAGFEPAGEAASGEEALRLVEDTKPQLVLVDVRMPGMDGVETARRLHASHPDLVVVLISLDDPPGAAATRRRRPSRASRTSGPRCSATCGPPTARVGAS